MLECSLFLEFYWNSVEGNLAHHFKHRGCREQDDDDDDDISKYPTSTARTRSALHKLSLQQLNELGTIEYLSHSE